MSDDLPDLAATLREVMAGIGRVDHVAVLAAHALDGPSSEEPTPVTPSAPDGDAAAESERTALWIDALARTVRHDGSEIVLCRREFDLLLFLAQHPRRVFTRRQLLASVWADPMTGERTVDVHVRRLRQKLAACGPLISTVRGIGYRLAVDARITVSGRAEGGSQPMEPAQSEPAAARQAAFHLGVA